MSDKWATGFTVREASWHRKEQLVMRDLLLPRDRDEAFVLAGHDFTVAETQNGNIGRVVDPSTFTGNMARVNGKWHSLDVRDEKKGLYIVQPRGDGFGPLHGRFVEVLNKTVEHIPNEIGWDLLEVMLGEGARLDTGFVLDDATCVITAYLPEPVVIGGDNSKTFPYVAASWGHDGSRSLSIRSTSVREVCWNTLTMSEALAKKTGTEYTFKHTKNWREKVGEAKKVIEGLRTTFPQYVALANELAEIELTEGQRDLFVRLIIGDAVVERGGEIRYRSSDRNISQIVRNNLLKDRAKILRAVNSPSIPEAHRLTGYGMLQAGTEYFDHLRAYRSQDSYVRRQLLSTDREKADLVGTIRFVAAQAA